MPATLYPQLHDPEFLSRTLAISAADLAAQLGCQPATVQWARQEHRVLRMPPWNEVEVELLSRFYGRCPTACIAEGLRRTRRSIYSCAHRLGLSAQTLHRATSGSRAHFWADWQRHIRRNLDRWVREGASAQAFEILWQPARSTTGCDCCPHLLECRGNAQWPVRCERLTVGEYLQKIHAQEKG
jgi:hypothetical protein